MFKDYILPFEYRVRFHCILFIMNLETHEHIKCDLSCYVLGNDLCNLSRITKRGNCVLLFSEYAITTVVN